MKSPRRCLPFLIALLAAFACMPISSYGQESEKPRIRILTYNIHHGRGMDGEFDYDRLAKIITDLKPDVVALQEVDRGVRRSGEVDQPAIMADLTGMHSAFGNALYHQGGEYGEAVLSRFPLEEVKAHHLPFHPGLEPRTALAVRIKPGDGLPELLFVGTHLCHQDQETRTEQTTQLDSLFSNADVPVIMAGDLNARPQSEPMQVLADNWIDAIAPRSRIDYILHRKSDPWQVVEVQIVDEPVASDHDPVLAVLEWQGEPQIDAPQSDAQGADSPVYSHSFDGVLENSASGPGGHGNAYRQQPGQPLELTDCDAARFAPDRDFSVQFWARTTADREHRFVLLSQKEFADNSLASQKNAGWVFYVSDGTLAWNLGSGSRRITYERDNGETLPLNDGRWHQLAMTHDSTAGLMRLYCDGRNIAIYNVRDSNGFDFCNETPLTFGGMASSGMAPESSRTAEQHPLIAQGAQDLQELVDAFDAFGMPALESEDLMRLVVEPKRLFASKRDALDPAADADLLDALQSADLADVEGITGRLMRNPYTIHQAPSFMEVAPLLKIYSLTDGRITIDREAAAAYAERERLQAVSFDLDELAVWDRTLTANEIHDSYAQHFPSTEIATSEGVTTVTAAAWNIFHGGIHHSVKEHGWDSRQAIVDLIRREKIDVVMMQETYSNGDYIAAELGYFYATTIDWDYLNQGANISVLSRYPIEEVTVPPGSPFMNVAAKIRLSENQHIYAMSNWYGMANFPEVYDFHTQRFAGADEIPVLFAGDFNAVPHTDGGESPASRQLLEAGFTDAFRSQHPNVESNPGVTHRSGSRIDQLYFKGAGLENSSTTVISTWPSLFPSDHYLIKAEFELSLQTSKE